MTGSPIAAGGLTPVSFKTGRASLTRLSPARGSGQPNARYWTEAQKQVVRDHYAAEGAQG